MSRATFWALLIGLAAGWFCRGWYQDSLQLIVERAASAAGNKSRVEMQGIASASGRALENKLEAMRDAQPKEIRREIIKPVFTNVCVSDDFVRMYNDAGAAAERALSGKSADEVPGKPATSAGEYRQ